MKNIDLERTIILIDFDGTITTEDTNDKLLKVFENEKLIELKESGRIKKLNMMEGTKELFNCINISEEEYLNFILNEIELTPGYKEFYRECSHRNIPIEIISGGFINGIEPFLRKHGVEDSKVYANKLHFKEGKIDVSFYHGIEDCCDIGGCGNCKVKHYERNKSLYKDIIFIGDGHTDVPLAREAKIVFAKDDLLKYCEENKIDCIPWQDFNDIIKLIF